jgi:hypothetical protein
MLNYLNGVESSQINGKLLDKFTTLKNNAIQKLPPKVLTAVNTAGKVASVGVKIVVAPMRLAFLGLVRLNTLHVAENLEKAIRKDRTKVMNWWKDFGGDFNELLKITNLGIKAGEKGKAQKLTGSNLGLVVATGTAVATATATPVLTSLVALLKNIGVEAVKGSADALVKAGKDKLTDSLNKGEKLPDVTTAVVIEQPKVEGSTEVPKTKADKTAEDVDPIAPIVDIKKSNMPLIIGGIAGLGLLAYFLMKKK